MAAEKSTTRPYVVAYVTPDETLKLIGSYVASTPKGAVEKAVEETVDETPAGIVNFVAVVQSSWNAFHGTGEMKMVFSIDEGHVRTAEPGDPEQAPPGPEEAPDPVLGGFETQGEDGAAPVSDAEAEAVAEAEAAQADAEASA